MSLKSQLNIRTAESRDVVALRELHAQPEVFHNTMQLPYPKEEHWLDRVVNFPAGGLNLIAETTDLIVGHASLIANPRALRRKHAAGVGMAVHKDWQGQGVGSLLMQELIDAADNWLDFRRLELDVFTDNHAAIALYKKFGFVQEGLHKAHSFQNGRYVDIYSMARLRDL